MPQNAVDPDAAAAADAARPAPKIINPTHGDPSDPNRATLLHVLKILNQAEDEYENDAEKGLDLNEIQYHCDDYWAVRNGSVKLPVILQLLLENKMVNQERGESYSWVRQRTLRDRYRITEVGKVHLVQNLPKDGRVE